MEEAKGRHPLVLFIPAGYDSFARETSRFVEEAQGRHPLIIFIPAGYGSFAEEISRFVHGGSM